MQKMSLTCWQEDFAQAGSTSLSCFTAWSRWYMVFSCLQLAVLVGPHYESSKMELVYLPPFLFVLTHGWI